MKSNRLYFIIIILGVLFVLFGCSKKSSENNPKNQPTENNSAESGERPSGYINTWLNAKDRAKTNVKKLEDAQNKAVQEGLEE
ncbi:MAG: hypothetical protein A3J63_03165 [Candidatus Moranbacteria bacterium RIFCSPHIGHO2_02_FULL_40_12b]|nr:MAG: hypothetical protein A3J63_03165 [Candidatus Moranbacteria bacterium RIFCSPHIGHO2_02_FULL_40_12b]OGI23204.1 MAG: hypothetical protein A3E91_01950 [Candidatus Moranbacteria bacterium RIFCSPHIGHO2_12_FULL_40_10]